MAQRKPVFSTAELGPCIYPLRHMLAKIFFRSRFVLAALLSAATRMAHSGREAH
jgi:hypothetical protein